MQLVIPPAGTPTNSKVSLREDFQLHQIAIFFLFSKNTHSEPEWAL